ncbi:hypothetical protein GA0116948_103150 [Chitinophaga costaii]|uniref:DUF4468 domain-containing protein n=1 Tax=Chitinophaga costaii TaxID=1335309 RepID=A0A1C4BL56_9BACT|nr:hypothetical protein [Chitinophaga costaii]PUZ27565.1 hypothetical protein DCM91_04895 [Chitinophaga costaii]SCC07553.1 hypothetical protein GA0116948_103150 [Chitinophaga costaii]
MKKLTLLLLVLAPLLVRAQKEAPPVPIPMKNNLVWYEKNDTVPGLSADSIAARAARWLHDSFPEANETLKISSSEYLQGTGSFRVTTSDDGHYYWLKFIIDIVVTPNKYTAQFYQYYEKPVEPGITNDWSKIGYRWWDYCQGKPWSVEDKTLFRGLHTQSLALLESLHHAVADY